MFKLIFVSFLREKLYCVKIDEEKERKTSENSVFENLITKRKKN